MGVYARMYARMHTERERQTDEQTETETHTETVRQREMLNKKNTVKEETPFYHCSRLHTQKRLLVLNVFSIILCNTILRWFTT